MKTDWQRVRAALQGRLSEEERLILDLLVAGKSQSDVGTVVGRNRAAVWRIAKRLTRLRGFEG